LVSESTSFVTAIIARLLLGSLAMLEREKMNRMIE
jgi:hypothetical protein